MNLQHCLRITILINALTAMLSACKPIKVPNEAHGDHELKCIQEQVPCNVFTVSESV